MSVKPDYFNCVTLKAVWFSDWEVIPTVHFVQHLRFSQWCCWGFWWMGMCRCFTGWAVPNSLKACGALYLWLLLAEAEGATMLQTVGSYMTKTQHYIPEDLNCSSTALCIQSSHFIDCYGVSCKVREERKNTLHGDCLFLYIGDLVLVPWPLDFFYISSVLENCS